MDNIIQEFEAFMRQHGTHYHQFYVGIASNPNERLINGHGIDATIPHIFWDRTLPTSVARAIEKYFLDKGSRGGTGGGDINTQFVYAYLITPRTRQ
ncbi:MAG: hypothetical protein MUD10_01525 [Candidatus Pacebacteria bacterium]|jgi:hypothetical protein|nr:hypothetical protein [Candidatus Paceibacterota bacterium]